MRENAAVKQEVKLFGWQLSSPMFEARAEDPSSSEQLNRVKLYRQTVERVSLSVLFFPFAEDSRGKMSCFCFIKSSGWRDRK